MTLNSTFKFDVKMKKQARSRSEAT